MPEPSSKEKYFLMMGGTAFIANPGNYRAGLTTNAATRTQAREEAMHKEFLVAQFEILARVKQALRDIIIKAVESDYLLEIEDETLVFSTKLLDSYLTIFATEEVH